MERQATQRSKSKIMRFLPKAAQAAVTFQNPPFSPGLEKRKGFSGPIVSMIPAEARGRSRNFETQEPTSPKVSCIGQVRHKQSIYRKKQVSLPKGFEPVSCRPDRVNSTRPESPAQELKKKASGIKKIFGSRRKSDAGVDVGRQPLTDRAPSLGQMRRFASSRDTLAGFDWASEQLIATPEGRDLSSDEDRGCSDSGEKENHVVVPFSARIVIADNCGLVLEPRKEINLWKRRALAAQPAPLRLNLVRVAQ